MITSLMYYLLMARGYRYNYPVPSDSFKTCTNPDSSSPLIATMVWLVYVPGIKCRLWVITTAYFVIHIKDADDIFVGISKLDYLIKVSVFQKDKTYLGQKHHTFSQNTSRTNSFEQLKLGSFNAEEQLYLRNDSLESNEFPTID